MAYAQAAAIRGAPTSRAVMLIARRHAAVPRALQLRVALDDWERNDVHERVRAQAVMRVCRVCAYVCVCVS